jgi:hypothetical protein
MGLSIHGFQHLREVLRTNPLRHEGMTVIPSPCSGLLGCGHVPSPNRCNWKGIFSEPLEGFFFVISRHKYRRGDVPSLGWVWGFLHKMLGHGANWQRRGPCGPGRGQDRKI